MPTMAGAVVRGVGMITAVGWSAHETAASVRAGICRCAEGGIDDLQGAPIVTAMVPDQGADGWQSRAVPAGIAARESRLLRLAASAIREAASSAPRPLPLVIAMPAVSMSDDQVLVALQAMTGTAIDVGASSVVRGGRSAGMTAIVRALRAGHDGVLAGGVDSGIDADSLAALTRAGRAKSEHAPAGFVAGEGAAIVLIGRGGGGLAEIRQVTDAEPDLTAAIASLMSEEARPTIGHVYSSMNGERRWAIEWATAATRHRDAFTTEPRLDHPAQAYGDLGAASGAALVALAALDRRHGTSLVYASGDDGLHGAALLTRIGD